ncbi:membrane progestin receptor beta-like [Glandiceps talaboti]
MTKVELGKLPRTKSAEEVPKLFREPNVHNGYRVPHQPMKYYIFSVFQVHNELLNVWTHVLASSFLLYQALTLAYTVDFLNDPYSWPLLLLCTSCCTYPFLSSLAHLLQSHSESIHYTCFFVDYLGISFYGFTSGLIHFRYSAEESYLSVVGSGWLFVIVNFILSCFTCFACGYAKVKYNRPYPYARKLWQLCSVGSLYIWIIFPIFQRVYACQMLSCTDESIYYHKTEIMWFLLGSLFFAVPYPQKFAPGFFDIIGHSHQLFHIFIPICTHSQIQAEYLDLQNRREHIKAHFQPTFMNTFGISALFILCNIIVVLWLRSKALSKIAAKKS